MSRKWIAALVAAAFLLGLIPLWPGDSPPRPARRPEPPASGRVVGQTRDGHGAPPERTAPAVHSADDTEPAAADARTTDLSPEFHGDVVLEGRVVDAGGAAVLSATIEVRPGCGQPFRAYKEAQAEALETRSGADGRFRFSRLPRAFEYELTAIAEHAVGTRLVRFERLQEGGLVEIRLASGWYERVRFVGPDRAPVSPSVAAPRPLYGPVLYESAIGPPSWEVRRRLNRLGISPDVGRGEFLVVYARLEPTLFPGADPAEFARRLREGAFAQPRTLDDPRWEPVTYESGPHRIGARAGTTDVVLHPRETDDDRRLHRVEFPAAAIPEAWGEARRSHALRLEVSGLGRAVWISAHAPTFFASSGAPFALRIVGFAEDLAFERIEAGREIVIRPDYPKLGYLSVHYEPRARREGLTLLWLHDFERPDRVWRQLLLVYPGYARIGPIPVGRYLVRMQWTDGLVTESGERHEDWYGPIDLEERLHVVHWR